MKLTYDIYFSSEYANESMVENINSFLASHEFSNLVIKDMRTGVFPVSSCTFDGTVINTWTGHVLYEGALYCETEEDHFSYSYQIDFIFIPTEKDRDTEAFRESWVSKYPARTMRQLLCYRFKEGTIYTVLWHHGKAPHFDPSDVRVSVLKGKATLYQRIRRYFWRRRENKVYRDAYKKQKVEARETKKLIKQLEKPVKYPPKRSLK